MTLPHINDLYLIGLLTSIGTAIIFSIKGLGLKGFSKVTAWFRKKIVYTVRIYQYDELFYILEAYLAKHHQVQYKDVEASIEWGSPIDNLSRMYPSGDDDDHSEESKKIHYKQEDNIFTIKWKEKRILVEKEREKEDKAVSVKERFFRQYKLTGYKCKDEINDFLETIFQEYEDAKPKQLVKIKTVNSYGEWRLFDDLRVKSFDKVFLPKGQKEILLQDIEDFSKAEEWYSKVGIPYKRGYCFHGVPGNGKTTLSLSLASKFRKDIHILNIGALDDDDALQRAFSSLKRNSILLIEDIDRSFVQREGKDVKVSFSCLLNALDGALSKHGLIVIITTNHIDRLDPALLRDGRIDTKIEIKNPDNEMISDYLTLFYDRNTILYETRDVCMASVQEICIRNKDSYQGAIRELKVYSGELTYKVNAE